MTHVVVLLDNGTVCTCALRPTTMKLGGGERGGERVIINWTFAVIAQVAPPPPPTVVLGIVFVFSRSNLVCDLMFVSPLLHGSITHSDRWS